MGWLSNLRSTFSRASDEIAEFKAAAEGMSGARAVVVSVESATPREDGRVDVEATLRLTGQWDDRVNAPVSARMSAIAAEKLVPGLDVPVRIDPETGDLTALDVDDFEAEAAGAAPRAPDAPGAETTVAMGGGAPAELRDDDPGLAPVEGVSFDLWVQVQAALIRDRVPPADYDAHAQRLGAPAGRWEAVHAEWMRRIQSDWRLGAKYGEAIEAARKRS